jgi:peptide/nickel transport system substrate-binding protein
MTRIRAAAVTTALAVVAVTALAACAGSNSPVANEGSGSGPDNPGTADQTFVYDSYNQVIVDWDPAVEYTNPGNSVMNAIYDTLTRYDATTGKVTPSLATRWKSTHDGKTWTFTLRPDVKFHDGKPVDSTAVKNSILRTKKLNQGAGYMWQGVTSVDTPSAGTVVFHVNQPTPLDVIASGAYSAYIYDTTAAGNGDLGKWFQDGHEAGSGPYTIDKWAAGSENELTLKAVPTYWGGWSGSHYKRVAFRVVSQDSTSSSLLRSGQVTYVAQMSPQLVSTYKNDPKYQVTSNVGWQNLILYYNTVSGPLQDVRLRKAIANAIDYKGMIAALQGSGAQQSGIIPDGLFGHTDSVPVWTQNMAQAKQLLAEAGYGPGKKKLDLTLTLTQGDSNEALDATLIKSNLAALNVDLTVQPLQTATKYAEARSTDPSKRQDMTMLYWNPDYADAQTWFQSLVRTTNPPAYNFSYYSNKTLDSQIDSVEALTVTNRAQAAQVYEQMERTVYDQVPIQALYTVKTQRVMISSVGGLVENPAYADVVFFYQLSPKG